MNSLNDQIAILQKQFNAAEAERKDIEKYKNKMFGSNSEISQLV